MVCVTLMCDCTILADHESAPGCVLCAQEELAAIGVWACVCHAARQPIREGKHNQSISTVQGTVIAHVTW